MSCQHALGTVDTYHHPIFSSAFLFRALLLTISKIVYSVTMLFKKYTLVTFLSVQAAVSGFVLHHQDSPGITSTSLHAIRIYYSTCTGNTETVSTYLSEAMGGVEAEDIGDAPKDDLEGADGLIIGAPTWHTGYVLLTTVADLLAPSMNYANLSLFVVLFLQCR